MAAPDSIASPSWKGPKHSDGWDVAWANTATENWFVTNCSLSLLKTDVCPTSSIYKHKEPSTCENKQGVLFKQQKLRQILYIGKYLVLGVGS